MKKIMVTIAAAMMALSVAAYNPGNGPGNYCVKSIHGKMVVELNGSPIKKDIKFKDGSCVKADGTVIMTNGKKLRLKEGECVNETSVLNLSKHKDGTWMKNGEKNHPFKKGENKSFKGEKNHSSKHEKKETY